MAKTLQEKAVELSKRGYTIELLRDKTTDGGYIYLARNPELEGCMAQGLTEEEALRNLDEVRIEHIEHLLEHNLAVPYPMEVPYSSRAVASTSVRKEYILEKEIPLVTFPGFEDYLAKVAQPNTRELVYSKTPNT